tara:strand:+ start:1322 stop:1483 length:162 start_codon:yes stop_codon:yes gene_type:complete
MKLKINKCLVCGNNFKNLEKFDNELDLCFKCFISYEKHISEKKKMEKIQSNKS